VEFGVEIKEIERGPIPAIKDAYGCNPPVPKNGCRLHFYDSLSAHVYTDSTREDSIFPAISCKGFQGFRYKWWEWDWEKENSEFNEKTE